MLPLVEDEDECTGIKNLDPICQAQQHAGEALGGAANSLAGSAIDKFAEAVAAGVAEALKTMATLWIQVPNPGLGSGSTAQSLQQSLFWYMAFAAVLSVIIGGARMAWEARADAGRDLIRSLVTLVLVTGAGLLTIKLALDAGDGFANWLIGDSIKDDSFGKRMSEMLSAVTATGGQNAATAAGMATILVIVLGLILIVSSMVQIVLMIARSAMLVLLAGVLPLSAAATNTAWGRQWFQKIAGWTIAFILYKPAAAIVYAAAFQMFGSEEGLMGALMGMAAMILAIFAMPALMRLCVPLVGGLSDGGSGGGMAVAGGAAAMAGRGGGPTGAVDVPSTTHSAGGGGGSGGGGPSGSGPGSPKMPAADGAKAASAGGGSSAGASTAAGASTSGAAAAAGPVGAGVAVAQAGYNTVKDGAKRAAEGDGPSGSS